MRYPAKNSLRSKLLVLILLLWAVPAYGGSPEAIPSPQCKAAVGLANLAAADVKEAFKSLNRAMDKTDQALQENKTASENFKKAFEARDPKPPSKFPKRDEMDEAWKALKESQSKERSARENLEGKLRAYDERVAESFKRCGRPE